MKPKPIKIVQNFRELQRLPGRSNAASPAGLYLLRLRSRAGFRLPTGQPLTIPVDFQGEEKTHAQAVKITHL